MNFTLEKEKNLDGDKVLPEMAKFGGTVFQTSLSHEDEETLKKALEHEDVKAAAYEFLDEDLK